MKKLIAFAFLASLVVGSVGCKSDGNGHWCMRNPFYRRPQQVLAYPPCEIPCVDNCCAAPACGTTYAAPGCDSCASPGFPSGAIVDPSPFQ